MDSRLLERIGLTKGEREIYLYLLNKGPVTSGPIVNDLGMQKSVVYFCLEKLTRKGLVTYFIKNNAKQFEASSPERIVDYLNEKQKEIEKQKKDVQPLIKEFETKEAFSREFHSAKVFEGWSGLKTAFQDILDECNEGEEYLVLGVTTVPETRKKFRWFIRQFHLKRSAQKIKSKLILSTDVMDSVGVDRESEPLTEVRYISTQYFTPAIANIYKDRVLFTIWAYPPYAFQLKSKEVANSFRSYFFALWKNCKTRKQLQKARSQKN